MTKMVDSRYAEDFIVVPSVEVSKRAGSRVSRETFSRLPPWKVTAFRADSGIISDQWEDFEQREMRSVFRKSAIEDCRRASLHLAGARAWWHAMQCWSVFAHGIQKIFLQRTLWVVVALPGIAAQAEARFAAPAQLQCEGKTDPLAVAATQPQLSWQLQAASPKLRNLHQSAYQVQVTIGANAGFSAQGLLWDSGQKTVAAGVQNRVSYNGGALVAGQFYMWRVRVWDEKGTASRWSVAARWRQAPLWRAQWIAAHASDAEAGNEPMPLLRKSFRVDGTPRSATLDISGLGQYEVHLNGKKIGDQELAPGWSDKHKTVFYDSDDVTTLLRKGPNALGIMLGNGMDRVRRTHGRYTKFEGASGPPQAIAQLHIEYEDGSSTELVTDESWKTHSGPIVFSSIYGGEDYDARRAEAGWDTADFDDAHWKPVVRPNAPQGELTPELAPSMRVMRTYRPLHTTEPKPGVTVYDLGQNFAGWPSIRVKGASGATIKLICGELLKPDGTVSQKSSGGPQWFSYTQRGDGIEGWHPQFSYYGFRYVQVETTPGVDGVRPRLLELQGEAVHSSSQSVGDFASSDELLNRIHALILRAVENNAESILTDCPHREKLGWLEQTHLLASAILYDFNFDGIYAALGRNIRDVQLQQGPKAGMVPEIVPQYVSFDERWDIFNDSPEWGSAAILAPWYLYQRNGNRAALLAQVETMRRYAQYLATRARNGIIDYGLGDWYDIGPGDHGFSKLTSSGVTATAIYYQDLRVLEKVMALAGDAQASGVYAQQAEQVRQAFHARFFDAKFHRYDKGSQTAQAMLLALGMVPETERAAVLDALVADIHAHHDHATAGDIGYHYVVAALLEARRADVLYAMLQRTDAPSYGYQLAQGATALTEAWDANQKNSQDHFMLGDAEEWFYRGLGGIDVDFAGRPTHPLALWPQVVDGLAWARTSYNSALGKVETNWHREASGIEYEFLIPAGVDAEVALPATNGQRLWVRVHGKYQQARLISQQRFSDRVTLTLGSGRYRVYVGRKPGSKQKIIGGKG